MLVAALPRQRPDAEGSVRRRAVQVLDLAPVAAALELQDDTLAVLQLRLQAERQGAVLGDGAAVAVLAVALALQRVDVDDAVGRPDVEVPRRARHAAHGAAGPVRGVHGEEADLLVGVPDLDGAVVRDGVQESAEHLAVVVRLRLGGDEVVDPRAVLPVGRDVGDVLRVVREAPLPDAAVARADEQRAVDDLDVVDDGRLPHGLGEALVGLEIPDLDALVAGGVEPPVELEAALHAAAVYLVLVVVRELLHVDEVRLHVDALAPEPVHGRDLGQLLGAHVLEDEVEHLRRRVHHLLRLRPAELGVLHAHADALGALQARHEPRQVQWVVDARVAVVHAVEAVAALQLVLLRPLGRLE
mmetsp:Transcript_11619/g.35290  ORF Transcript_11619/g.35290 Transcript_11619/m.35290 type:complete len:357 (-) Transcript_11619:281-1351(-)